MCVTPKSVSYGMYKVLVRVTATQHPVSVRSLRHLLCTDSPEVQPRCWWAVTGSQWMHVAPPVSQERCWQQPCLPCCALALTEVLWECVGCTISAVGVHYSQSTFCKRMLALTVLPGGACDGCEGISCGRVLPVTVPCGYLRS